MLLEIALLGTFIAASVGFGYTSYTSSGDGSPHYLSCCPFCDYFHDLRQEIEEDHEKQD